MPELITNVAWAGLPWLVHGCSTRAGGRSTAYQAGGAKGDLNLGFTAEDDREVVAANRKLLLNHLLDGHKSVVAGIVTARQVHADVVHRVDEHDLLPVAASPTLEGDGLMTNEPGVLLGILTADCVPVLVVDVRVRAVAAFHAGWRGTLRQVVETGVLRLREEFGSCPEDLRAMVGPAIGSCCYLVGEQVRDEFTSRFSYGESLFAGARGGRNAGTRLDLAEANRRQLIAAGLAEPGIFLSGYCTSCETDRFFSHRADRGVTGRMMSAIGVLDG